MRLNLLQSGNSTPAFLHVVILCISSSVHMSTVPFVHVRVCIWIPSSHTEANTDIIELHGPSFCQSPKIFGAEIAIIYISILFLIQKNF